MRAWPHVWASTTLVNNWHFKYLCEQIQDHALRVINNQPRITDLCINVPPGTAKSTIISICLPAWVWALDPSRRFITTSYSGDLAFDHCRASRKLIESEWYQQLWGNKYQLVGKSEGGYDTDKGGRRMITCPGSGVGTGFHADFLIFDDPNSAKQIYSEAHRNEAIVWFDETMPSRLSRPEIGLKIVVQQRLHLSDVTGHIKDHYPGSWKFIVLPATLSDNVYPVELAKNYINGQLFPARLTPSFLKSQMIMLQRGYVGQYLMSPRAVGGNFFKESWVNWYKKEQLPRLEQIIISVDASFDSGNTSCPVSIQAWGKRCPNYYMLYDLTQRMGAIESNTAIERVARSYPGALIVVERAANGYFLIEMLKKKFPVYEFLPNRFGGKEERAEQVAPLWEVGNVHVFDSVYNRTQYITEILDFPNNELKDRVDAMAQALLYFSRCSTGNFAWSNKPIGV